MTPEQQAQKIINEHHPRPCLAGALYTTLVASFRARDTLYARAWAECEAWRGLKPLSPISLIDAPIVRAKMDHDAARKAAGLEGA